MGLAFRLTRLLSSLLPGRVMCKLMACAVSSCVLARARRLGRTAVRWRAVMFSAAERGFTLSRCGR